MQQLQVHKLVDKVSLFSSEVLIHEEAVGVVVAQTEADNFLERVIRLPLFVIGGVFWEILPFGSLVFTRGFVDVLGCDSTPRLPRG